MGGCATKPKVLKGDERDVPAPAPPTEPTKEPVSAVPEAKGVADVVAAEQGEKKGEADGVVEVVGAKDVDEAREVVIADDDKVDDQANKRQSLSNLFEENEKEGAAESDNPPSEPTRNESPVEAEEIKSVESVKQELSEPGKQAPSETEKLKETNETTNQESEEPEKPIEQTYEAEPLSAAPGKIESAQSVKVEAEAAPEATTTVNVTETQSKETSAADNKEGKTEVAK